MPRLILSFLVATFVGLSGFAAHATDTAGRSLPSTVVVGVAKEGWPPFEIARDDQLSGFSLDLLTRMLARSGVTVEIKTFPSWSAVFEAACRGDIDLVLAASDIAERRSCLRFTSPYYVMVPVIVTRRGSDVTAATLLQHPLALPRQFATTELLREAGATGLTVASAQEGLNAVRDGRADAIVESPLVVTHLLQGNRYPELTVAGTAPLPSLGVSFAVPTSEPGLYEALQKRLLELSSAELLELQKPWIGVEGPSTYRLSLNHEETQWVASLPPLRVGWDRDSAPLSFVDERGQPNGISATYLGEMGRAIGLKFEYAPEQDWTQTLAAASTGDIDVVMGLTVPQIQRMGWLATQPYASFPEVFVVPQNAPSMSSAHDLFNRRIVLREGAPPAAEALVRQVTTHVLFAPTAEAALTDVAEGRADAYLGNLAVVDQLINTRFTSRLRVGAPAGLTLPLAMGVSPSRQPLVALLDRANQAMPVAERARIRSAWIGPSDRYIYDFTATVTRLTPAIVAVIAVLIVLAVINRRLRREVTARELAEEDLREQWLFERALMDTVPFPVLVTDAQGRYRAANAAFGQAYRIDLSQWVGAPVAELPPPAPFDTLTDPQATRQGTECHIVHEGAPRTVLYWQRPLRDDVTGQVRSVFATTVDVTEIRQAEEAARRARERLENVTRHLPGVVFELHRQANGQLTLPYVAGNAEPLFGVSAAQLMSRPADLSLVAPEHRLRVLRALERSWRHQAPLVVEFRTIATSSPQELDDEPRWIRAHAAIYAHDANRTAWSGYWVDITDQHAQAEALQDARRIAEHAARSKATFLATMSHEIRTPMSGIVGMVELLAQTALESEQQQMIEIMDESMRILGQILDDVLDFSKIEAGQLALAFVDTNLRRLIDHTVAPLAAAPATRGVRVRVRVDTSVLAVAHLDPVRTRQILTNLVSNAIKFTERGQIDIRVRALPNDAGLRIVVRDTGVGISPDALERIFAPFTQADETVTQRYGGTGLGLAISRQLALLMHGDLTITSTVGVGTEAALTLPCHLRDDGERPPLFGRTIHLAVRDPHDAKILEERLLALGASLVANTADMDEATTIIQASDDAEVQGTHTTISATAEFIPSGIARRGGRWCISLSPVRDDALLRALQPAAELAETLSAAAARKPAPEASPLPQQCRILVAEDHPINQTLITRQLALLGQDAHVVPDGQAALAALADDTYDLLLTDCQMQPMDGFTLARTVRATEHQHPGGPRLPIVAMTATVTGDTNTPWYDAGMDDYLAKPVRLSALRAMLERWLPATPAARPLGGLLHSANVPAADMHVFVDQIIQSTESALGELHEEHLVPLCELLAHWLHRHVGALRIIDTASLWEACAILEQKLKLQPSATTLADALTLLPHVRTRLDVLAQDNAFPDPALR